MKRTIWLRETRLMRFEEACEDWTDRCLPQEEAAFLPACLFAHLSELRVSLRGGNLRGVAGSEDERGSHRRVPEDEVMQVVKQYRPDHEARRFPP